MPALRDLLQIGARALCGPCPCCGRPRSSPLCGDCRLQSGITEELCSGSFGPHDVRFVGAYHAASVHGRHRLSPLGRCLRSFKDHGDRYAGRCLSRLFAEGCAPLAVDPRVVVPVPPDAVRLRERGFSPATWLARGLASRSGVRLRTSALRRVPGRPPQRGLGGSARRDNVRGAFVRGPCSLEGCALVLVDDVVTTGATLRDAARALREAGAREVLCAVLACADEDWMHHVDR